MISDLQSDDAAEPRRRIVNDVGEITVQSDEHGVETLRGGNNIRVFRVDREVVTQQFHQVSGGLAATRLRIEVRIGRYTGGGSYDLVLGEVTRVIQTGRDVRGRQVWKLLDNLVVRVFRPRGNRESRRPECACRQYAAYRSAPQVC